MQDEKNDKNCFSINKNTDILMNNEFDIPLVDEGVEDIFEKTELENFINDNKDNSYIKENSKDNTDKVSVLQNDEKVLKESIDSEKIINNFEKLKLNQEESIESISSLNDIDTLPLDLNQFDTELNSDEKEEKERLIQQLIELRSTLDDLSQRVSSVKEETFKLANENNVLNQYVENLMSASSVFQSTATTNANAKRKQRKQT